MRIAVVGASGTAGRCLVEEAQRRGHEVTAVVRSPGSYKPLADEKAVFGNVQDLESLSAVLAGHDVVISAVTFQAIDPDKLIGAVRRSGVKRFVSIGGAGSLWAKPGTLFIDSPDFPADVIPESRAGIALLNALLVTHDLEWTMTTPPAVLELGQRTGAFRLGKDDMLYDDDGKSRISYQDLAVAMLNEIDEPQHVRQRYTVGY
jgi:hypothetical protein